MNCPIKRALTPVCLSAISVPVVAGSLAPNRRFLLKTFPAYPRERRTVNQFTAVGIAPVLMLNNAAHQRRHQLRIAQVQRRIGGYPQLSG
ncbi:hypothetical protein SODG_002797 [Sodalis praecaptivus]